MRIASVLAFLPLLLSVAPATAKEQPGKARDPNQVVCENEEVLGSRLATRRVCMTRAQWAERQREERAMVDRHQTEGCVMMNGQCTH